MTETIKLAWIWAPALTVMVLAICLACVADTYVRQPCECIKAQCKAQSR